MDKLYTAEEAAKVLSVHVETLRLWLRTGRLKGVRIGRMWRVHETELEAFTKEKPE